jgi:hypothetical protein
MSPTQRKYPKEEFARRGDAIFEQSIQPQLRPEDDGKFLAIDIETGEYALGEDELEAGDHLRQRVPDAQIWMKLVGSPYLHRFG